MDMNGEKIPGIWYEAGRDRWRVKIVRDRKLLQRSYHKTYEEALTTWTEVQKNYRSKLTLDLPLQDASLVHQFICQPLVRG